MAPITGGPPFPDGAVVVGPGNAKYTVIRCFTQRGRWWVEVKPVAGITVGKLPGNVTALTGPASGYALSS
jgi:hypothetical protein